MPSFSHRWTLAAWAASVTSRDRWLIDMGSLLTVEERGDSVPPRLRSKRHRDYRLTTGTRVGINSWPFQTIRISYAGDFCGRIFGGGIFWRGAFSGAGIRGMEGGAEVFRAESWESVTLGSPT